MPPSMKAAMTLHRWVWLCPNKTLLAKAGCGPDSADGLCPAVVLDREKALFGRDEPSLRLLTHHVQQTLFNAHYMPDPSKRGWRGRSQCRLTCRSAW